MKQARLQAGLSLGKIARDDISRTAIYFVETGKAKPSFETLHLIAERTGQPIDFFLPGSGERLDPSLLLAQLERLLATGDNAGVVAAAEEAMSHQVDPETDARVKVIASMGHLRLAQPVVGRRLAAAARAHFEAVGNLEMVAECLGNEAQGAYLMQDPSALSIAEGALATCRSLKPVPPVTEARLLRVMGHTLINNDRWHEAIDYYEQAIDAAGVVQDLQQLSLVYAGLSLAYQETGHINDAVRYAQKALTIHETLHDRISQARVLNNLGWMLVRLGELGRARDYLDEALSIFDDLGVEAQKSTFLMSFAELEFAEGNLAAARSRTEEALELAARFREPAIIALARTMLGRIAAREDRHSDADDEFGAALEAGREVGGHRLMEIHEQYAAVLEARGDLAAANHHLRQAIAAYGQATPPRLESRIAIA